jgi:hypothetical protein
LDPEVAPADHLQVEADAVIPASPELIDLAARFGRVRRPDFRFLDIFAG